LRSKCGTTERYMEKPMFRIGLPRKDLHSKYHISSDKDSEMNLGTLGTLGTLGK